MQSVPITTNVVSVNPVHDGVYLIQHYVIKFVSDLWEVENSLIVGKSQLTGSSSKDSHTGPNNGRLNEQEKKPTAWVPS
jgi:hypothetical protein